MAIYKSKSKKHIKSKLSRKKTMKKNRKRISKMRGGWLGSCGPPLSYQEENELIKNVKYSGYIPSTLGLTYVQETACKAEIMAKP